MFTSGTGLTCSSFRYLSAKSSSPFSLLQMEVQETLGQSYKDIELEIECMSELKKGKSFESPRSVTSHRSSASNTMSLIESNESGCGKYSTQTHSTPLSSPCSMPYCSPEAGNQIIVQVPRMMQLGQTHSYEQGLESKRQHHGARRYAFPASVLPLQTKE